MKRLALWFSILVSVGVSGTTWAGKSGVAPNVISLPKGPGSVSGLGESFSADLNTGSSSYRVPIRVPPGTGGLTPSVSVTYSSGGKNTEVGSGWSLGIPRVQRRTEKGLPRYDESDVFALSGLGGTEELVPIAGGFYRFEVEGAYVRARRGETGWEVRTKSGTIYWFGQTSESRIERDGRVFAWYLTDQFDTLGNHIRYIYEKHGGRPYLRWIRYNDFSPDVAAVIELIYEERPDALSGYRSGFKVATGLRLKTIESRVGGSLLARYELEYDSTAALSRLTAVTMFGTDGVTALPTLTLEYYRFEPGNKPVVTMQNPPGRTPADANNSLADLNGDSLADLLVTRSGSFSYYINDGGKGWLSSQAMDPSPSVELSQQGIQLADVDGNGRIDLLAKLGSGTGDFRYFPSTEGVGVGFPASVPLSNNPTFDFEDPDVKLLDVTGDGRADVVRTVPGELILYENLGGGAYADGVILPPIDSNMEVRFSNTENVKLEDMNGDGLVDVVHVRSGSVIYWPQMGRGSFDAPVQMAGAPTLDDLSWLEIRDLNGDGLGDLARVGVTQVEYWINRGDGSFSPVQVISDTPYRGPTSVSVHFADMNGNGSVDIVWVDITGAPEDAWKYLDVMGSNRPGLIKSIRNGLGKTVRIEYSSSGEMSAEARGSGNPWGVELPVPVQVVSRITIGDSLGNEMVTEFEYRDGYYDGREREFRGFGQVKRIQKGDEHTPTLVAVHEFDVGQDDKARKGVLLREQLEDESGHIFKTTNNTFELVTLASGTDGRTVREARMVSTETSVVEGTSTPRTMLVEFRYDQYGNTTEKYEWGEVVSAIPGRGEDERFTFSTFAVNEQDWILDKVASTQVQDAEGRVLRWTRLYYDGQDYEGLPLGQVTHGVLKRQESWTGEEEDRWIPTKRVAHDGWGNIVGVMGPREELRTIEYDDLSHRFPVVETVHVGDRNLTAHASYDQIRGVLTDYENLNGHHTRFRYDPLGRITAVIQPGDTEALPTVEYVYELDDPVSAVWTHQRRRPGDAETLDKVTYYDGLGRKRSVLQKAEDGKYLELAASELDARGQVAIDYEPYFVQTQYYQPPDPSQNHTTLFRDAMSRQVRTVLVDGTITHKEYKPLAVVIHDENDTDPSSEHYDTPSVHRTDGLGRLRVVEEDTGIDVHATEYLFNAAGNLLSITDAEGNVRNYFYDALGRRVATDDPNAGYWIYKFDDSGNETGRYDPEGRAVLNIYDNANRLLEERRKYPGSGEKVFAKYHYDQTYPGDSHKNTVGRLGWIEDEAGHVAYGYDERGRSIVEKRGVAGAEYTTRHEYDSANRLTALIYPDRTRVTYQYNERSLVARVGGLVLDQQFGPDGSLLFRKFGNGVEETRQYDLRRRIIRMEAQDSAGGVLQRFAYSFDAASNITGIADQRAGLRPEQDQSVEAQYDALYRLKEAKGNGYQVSWNYSPAGKVLRRSGTVSTPISTLKFGDIAYGEEGAGPHAATSISTAQGIRKYRYDACGNLVSTPDLQLRYNAIQQVDEVSTQNGTRITNVFGHDGTRVIRRTEGGTGKSHETVYLGTHAEVRDGKLIKYVTAGRERIVMIGSSEAGSDAQGSESNQASLNANRPPASSHPLIVRVVVLLVLLFLALLSKELQAASRPVEAKTTVAANGPSPVQPKARGIRRYVRPGTAALALAIACCTGVKSRIKDLDYWPKNAHAILHDHLGGVHLIVDAQGTVVHEENNLPFGHTRYKKGQIQGPYSYAGAQRDDDTGLLYLKHRILVAETESWNRPDAHYLHNPAASAKDLRAVGDYHYAEHNPVKFIDPDGKNPASWLYGKLKAGARWSRRNIFHLGKRPTLKRLRDPNFRRAQTRFCTVTAPKVMKAVIEAMFIVEGIAGVHSIWQAWRISKAGRALGGRTGAGTARYYRYVAKGEVDAINKTRMLRGGDRGKTFFTTQNVKSASTAQRRMALPTKPTHRIEFQIVNKPRIVGPRTVKPAYNQPGGSHELFARRQVKVRMTNVQPLKN